MEREPFDRCPMCGESCNGCPTKQEIAKRAAVIRAGWSEEEERKRRCHVDGKRRPSEADIATIDAADMCRMAQPWRRKDEEEEEWWLLEDAE